MQRLATVVVVVVVATMAVTADAAVPGCPDLDVLENQAELSPEALNNLILCFCKPTKKDNVAISCLYGSNLDHLRKATDAVKKAGLSTSQISIQHMEFPPSGLPKLAQLAPNLQTLDVRECAAQDPLAVPSDAFTGLEQTLRNLTIHSCNLATIPTSVDALENLETLALSSNKLESLNVGSFRNKKQLSYLDVSGNFISTIEPETFAELTSLETLVIGEHNFMNETVFAEIGRLKALKTLDLSRADGVFEPPMELFDELPQLETLKLSGCSIPSLEPGQFAALKQLRELDLRVNLIENVSAYAFDGLENLRRLSLAGNYISRLEPDILFGLSQLTDVDLGWNEIKQIPENVFKPVTETLKHLNLRHNPITTLPPTGLTNLEKLTLGECALTEVNADMLKEYPKLKELEMAKCNISSIDPNAFAAQKDTLKKLNLHKNHLKAIPEDLFKDLSALEELDVSSNPYICDADLSKFIFQIEDRVTSAKDKGHQFKLANANETTCDRPYKLRGEVILDVDVGDLQPYDADSDVTQAPTTTATPDAGDETPSTPLKIPALFIGSETNDTLFKEEPRRDVYDLSKSDETKGVFNEKSSYALPITVGVIAIVSLIVIVAVALFLKKTRKIGGDDLKKGEGKTRSIRVEDGMVEIELDSQPNTQHAPPRR